MPFDLTVHHRDRKTGKVHRVTPYRKFISKDNGTYILQNGEYYYESGEIILDKDKIRMKLMEPPKVEEPKPEPMKEPEVASAPTEIKSNVAKAEPSPMAKASDPELGVKLPEPKSEPKSGSPKPSWKATVDKDAKTS